MSPAVRPLFTRLSTRSRTKAAGATFGPMTAVLGVIVIVVGLIALVLLVLLVRRSAAAGEVSSRLERVESELARRSQELERAEHRADQETRRRVEEGERAGGELDVARSDAAEAASRADAAEGRAALDRQALEEARRQVVGAEARARRAEGRADPDRGDDQLPAGSVAASALADALWDLERLRLEREWYAIGGLPIPMPAGWDGADGNDLAAAVAVELEVIREVVGTPGHMDPPTGVVTADPGTAVVATRLAGELLRRLARGGLELTVTIEADDDLAIGVATAAGEAAEDLSRLATAASRAGGSLDVATGDDGVRVEVRLPRT